MAIVRWKNKNLMNPWDEFKALQDEINSLFDTDRVPSNTGLYDRNVSPSIDIIESEHEFTVLAELPGLEEKEIDVSITSNVLTIKGNKTGEAEDKQRKYYKKESWSGSFQRTLSLPEAVDSEKISAKLSDGILTISLPKREEAKPKQIAVKVN